MALRPTDPVTALKGIGPSLRDKLKTIGIHRVGDLLLHLPLRYEDRSTVTPLRSAMAGQTMLIQAQVVDSKVTYGKRRSWLVTVEDGTGFLGLRFYHFSKAQQHSLQTGMYVQAFGTGRFGASGLELTHPEYRGSPEPFTPPEPELTPVYPTTKGLGQLRLRKLATAACARIVEHDGWPLDAIRYLHQPPAAASTEQIEYQQSQIALDELTAYYLIMRHQQRTRQGEQTLALPPVAQLGRELQKRLGFTLTGAQKRALTDVLEALSESEPMLRLIQGDVGSGKTIVAAFAAIRAAEHDAQTALMAPTEILAEQHYLNFSQWLSPLGIEVVLITGSLKAKERRVRETAVAEGRALVVIGTHALFQQSVAFHNLGLTIIDEQHRFGVHQRMALRDKGRLPHQLIMTATPIPRTLTMALYADMAVSLIDELPKGRQPISTVVVSNDRREEMVARIREVMAAGQQAYWVCTLIEESEQLPASAAELVAPELRTALSGYSVGLLHGRMAANEKAEIMAQFKAGAINLLVATTVVEVGVDVPNATLMVIEDPNRLGLSQLHQLRGRVGRGSEASHCVLLYKTPLGKIARERLSVIRDSQDGFYIAEQDLKLRGPGELLGARQTGEQQFRIADLRRDADRIPEVIARGDHLLKEDPASAAELLKVWAPADTGTINV
ncbi:MAG: ATP-dependent DNA helicase RecG [Pseudomonadales bacterium]